MTTGPDVLTEAAERGRQPLRPPGRREALQHPPDPDRPMGVLGPAVEVLRAAVPHRRQQPAVSELLRQYIRPYRRLLAVLVVLQVISTLASLYLPTVNAAIIDDGVIKGDAETIARLGGVMLAVTGPQVVCSVGVVYFGSRTAMGFGRDLRSAMFHHITTFSERETARFGAPSLLTRTTNDVRQIQSVVQTCTVLVIAPIMCVGGIFRAIRQNAGLSWLLLVSVPCWPPPITGSCRARCRSSAACRG